MKPKDIISIWESLEDEAGAGSSLIRRRIEPDANLDIFASYLPRPRSPGLIVEVAALPKQGSLKLPECRGISLSHETGGNNSPNYTIVRIQLEDTGLLEIFAILCADLVGHMAAAPDPASALSSGLRRLGAWQAMFERVRKEGLSPEKQRGLFGELHVLRSLILPDLDPIQAVMTWQGWEPSNQDFQINGLAIECKTSMAKRHVKVRISNEKQLDERPHAALVLAYVRMDESETLGSPLPELVSLIRHDLQTQPVARQDFDVKLMQAGYLESQAELYELASYKIQETRFYQVRDEFPRLTDNNLPEGVGDISYSIIPSDLADYEIAADEMQEMIRNSSERD